MSVWLWALGLGHWASRAVPKAHRNSSFIVPHSSFTVAILVLAFLLPSGASLQAAEAGPAADEAKAKSDFEAAYEAGAAAAIGKKWAEAAKHFETALKALGDLPHPKKPVARVLLDKARNMAKREEALDTAAELLKLKQWAEAEAAYRKAAETLGETEVIKAGIAAAQAGARIGKDAAAQKPTPAVAPPALPQPLVAPPPVPAVEVKPVIQAVVIPTPLEVPAPGPLDREQWQQGPGSYCYWAGERLYLEEGDEGFKKVLTKDFAAAVALEARMDHRSQVCIELRPARDSSSKTRVVGWGSKEGSPPMLALDKEVIARGDARPPQERITLAFVRNGPRVEFYCNGKLIGHAQDAKSGQPYYLWVSGKGILDGAKVIER